MWSVQCKLMLVKQVANYCETKDDDQGSRAAHTKHAFTPYVVTLRCSERTTCMVVSHVMQLVDLRVHTRHYSELSFIYESRLLSHASHTFIHMWITLSFTCESHFLKVKRRLVWKWGGGLCESEEETGRSPITRHASKAFKIMQVRHLPSSQ